jgi:tape measure domain-containing protein
MAIEMQSISRRMDFVTGGGKKLDRALAFTRKTAKSLSLSLEDLTSSYANLAAATRSTGLSTKQVEGIFLGLSEASSVFGLSAFRTKMVFKAITDMASKGFVQMEELKRQLGDHLPGALNTMADALGVSTGELTKLVSTGQVAAEKALPLFALQLRVDMYDAVQKLGKGVRSSMAEMKTAWFDFKKELTKEGGIGEVLTKEVIDIGSSFVEAAKLMAWGTNVIIDAFEKSREKFGEFAKFFKKTKDDEVNIEKEGNQELAALEEELSETRKAYWGSVTTSSEEELKAWSDVVNQTASSVASEFTSLIVGMATGADVSFRKMLDNMAAKLLEFTTHMLVVRPILEWFGTWLKGVTAPGGAGGKGFLGVLFSSLGAGVAPAPKAMAEGGMINEPVAGIGLKSNTPYLMGEKGPEAVIPEDKLGGGAPNITVNLSAVDAKSFNQLMKENSQAIIGPIVNAINSGDRGLNTSLKMAVS